MFSLSLLLHSFFAFLASFFFLAWHLVGFILVGRGFRKAFRILGLGERKGRWAMEQDFHGDLQVNLAWFFAFFSGVLDWIVLILVWFERSLHSAQGSGQSCPWPLKLMTSQAVERTWVCSGGYGRLRGEWVNCAKKWPAFLRWIRVSLTEDNCHIFILSLITLYVMQQFLVHNIFQH